MERESLMTKLEDFERAASDPNRFFVKGKSLACFPLTLFFFVSGFVFGRPMVSNGKFLQDAGRFEC